MPQSRPIAPDMLAVVREWLDREVLPEMADDRKFNMRVAINVLATVERELRQGPALNQAEAERLAALLGRDGAQADLNKTLSDEIRAGKRGLEDRALVDHIRKSVDAALAINNPKWSSRKA